MAIPHMTLWVRWANYRKCPVRIKIILGCHVQTIFQLYRGGQLYWWRKQDCPAKTNDWPVANHLQTLSHNVVWSTPMILFCVKFVQMKNMYIKLGLIRLWIIFLWNLTTALHFNFNFLNISWKTTNHYRLHHPLNKIIVRFVFIDYSD
jgi:hypothetical protein